MPFRDQRFHVPVEEREQQGRNMGAVHVRIGHDDDFSVPCLADVEVFPDAAAESRDHVLDLIAGKHTVQTGFFHVQDFTAQRQYSLELPVTSLLGAAAGRITFHQVNFRHGIVFTLAVC